jgi:hypothetical protein
LSKPNTPESIPNYRLIFIKFILNYNKLQITGYKCNNESNVGFDRPFKGCFDMPEFQDFQKRMPSVDRTVSAIRPDDVRVAVIGTVIDSQENRVIIDDGTGKLTVSFEAPVTTENAKLVRVLGRVIPMEGGVELQGDVIQPMDGIDMVLKKKVDDAANV